MRAAGETTGKNPKKKERIGKTLTTDRRQHLEPAVGRSSVQDSLPHFQKGVQILPTSFHCDLGCSGTGMSSGQ